MKLEARAFLLYGTEMMYEYFLCFLHLDSCMRMGWFTRVGD